MKAYGGVEV